MVEKTAPRSPYHIRPATPADIPLLTPIERAAAQRFREFGLPETFIALTTPLSALTLGQSYGMLWVATLMRPQLTQQASARLGTRLKHQDDPVGFALTGIVGDSAHLEELNVHPDHSRRGLGTALVQTALDWAVEAGLPGMTLTTLRHIPWNAPFYERLGFQILRPDELSTDLQALLAAECASGLSGKLPATDRVAMKKSLME